MATMIVMHALLAIARLLLNVHGRRENRYTYIHTSQSIFQHQLASVGSLRL